MYFYIQHTELSVIYVCLDWKPIITHAFVFIMFVVAKTKLKSGSFSP